MGLDDTVAKAINWKIPVVDGRDSLRTVIGLMNKEKVSALTVKDEEENVIGVITDMDVMDCIVRKLDFDRTKTEEIMTTCGLISDQTLDPCAQLGADETVCNALSVMNKEGIHHLMISDGNKKVGMISITDMLKMVLD
jgi:signal-transduction protein with cAMP-binding, CBS, and nucleotidyltransferase domain